MIIHKGRIVKGVGGLYTVKCDDGVFECRARGVFRNENTVPSVGDYVETDGNVISAILPRKNMLIRPACANIDKLILVVALSSPDPDVYNIDKMTAIASYHDIEPILVFNKTDLDDVTDVRKIYTSLPIKHIEISAASGNVSQLEPLREEIKDCTVAFSGLSGVGKSTIVNLLDPSVIRQTGVVSDKIGRGKHTTRCVELFDICGGFVMDTPGFSSLLLEFFDIKDRTRLQYCFPEFEPYLGKCRFTDCHHIKEPECAVSQAVIDGLIPASRYESYKKMFEKIGPLREWKD